MLSLTIALNFDNPSIAVFYTIEIKILSVMKALNTWKTDRFLPL